MGNWDYFPHYKPSTPRMVKHGIKSRRKSGEIGETWWAKKFLGVLEGFGWSNRLQRGRNYARMGQVIEFKIDYGIIRAKVQGSRSTPYEVEIKIKPLSKNQWAKVIKIMASQSRFLARLLTSQMPQDIEEVFKEAKIALFAASSKDFVANCSCPDWANPCKHIAAVYYIVAEAFDRDPFLIFHLRGKKKDELLQILHKEAGIIDGEEKRNPPVSPFCKGGMKGDLEGVVEPLSEKLEEFWKTKKKFEHCFSLKIPSLNAAILHRLGVPQFWYGTEKEFYEKMENIYKRTSEVALKIAFVSDEH